jgi:hypothetical protein
METSAKAYQDQIENWMETACEVAFGEAESGKSPCPTP